MIRRDLSEERAIEAVAALRRATVVPVDESLALDAADIALAHGLAMADALVYATARRHRATLVTADADFRGLPDVVIVERALDHYVRRARAQKLLDLAGRGLWQGDLGAMREDRPRRRRRRIAAR